MKQAVTTKQRGNAGIVRHLQITQGHTDTPVRVVELVDQQFKVTLDGGVQAGALQGFGLWRNLHFAQARRQWQRGALQQQRHQHHHKGQVEQQLRLLQAGQQRENSQNDRYCATQANPGDKQPLTPGKDKGCQADQYRDGAGNQNQKQRDHHGGHRNDDHLAGGDQQA